jgi:hypothetical protein
MKNTEALVYELKLAEHQFRLACTVNLAVLNDTQPLDTPMIWTFGKHRVEHSEFGLRKDQAGSAAWMLELTATMVLAGAIRDVVCAGFDDPKSHKAGDVRNSYQISRMIRNAFSHNMARPKWSIDKDCMDKSFEIPNVIGLTTTGLHGEYVKWEHYGGPLAIFRFARFVRETLLDSPVDPDRQVPPAPNREMYQQGRFLATKITQLPEDAKLIATIKDGETFNFGKGHYLSTSKNGKP